jgi:hypothetical protein
METSDGGSELEDGIFGGHRFMSARPLCLHAAAYPQKKRVKVR